MAEALNSTPNVAVIGGGCAGLAAASLLASSGIPVTVFEAAKQLGGRARGVAYKDMMLDNGQHIMLGAYRETLKLLAQTDISQNHVLMRLPLELHMKDLAQKRTFALKVCNALPAPLHLLVGLIFARGLNLTDKWRAISFMLYLKSVKFKLPQDLILARLLAAHKQTDKVIKNLWEPLCLAALNTPITEASAQVFMQVLRDSFTRKKSDSDLLLPKADLSALLPNPLADSILRHGGSIRLSSIVNRITPYESGYLIGAADDSIFFSHVIIACAPFQLERLCTELPHIQSLTRQFSYQAITTVYLQYPENTQLPRAMTGMTGTLSQWVFDRGLLCGQAGLIAVIISANGSHQTLSQEAISIKISEELSEAFANIGKPIWQKVIIEKRATFSCTPNLERPQNLTPYANLYLAGDYTQSDYPATIEGAILSGLSAARLIANH